MQPAFRQTKSMRIITHLEYRKLSEWESKQNHNKELPVIVLE